MKIQKTFERKTAKNHYKRFFAESADGLTLWWVDSNKGVIDGARRRIYTDATEEVSTECRIALTEIPAEVVAFIKKEWAA